MESPDITSGDIAAAVEAAKPESASPATQSASAEPPASATETPAAAAPKADEFGPLPYERHHAILDKTRRDYESKLNGLSWAEGLTRKEVEEALALQRLYRTQPDRLASHLSERVNANAEPQPDVKDERGDLFYSPGQAAKWASWKAQQEVSTLRAEMEERYGPIESEFAEHRNFVALKTDVESVMSLPGASQFETQMAEYVADINQRRANGERIAKPTAMDAYLAIVPKALAERGSISEAEMRKKVLAEINSTTERVKDDVNPSRVPAASRKSESEMSTKELLQREHDRRAALA